jgi:ubiquitin-conjugating enzyme E2 variant
MFVGEKYPYEPPEITFISKINMPGVNQTTGAVDKNSFSTLKSWARSNTLLDALKCIRKEMESSSFKKLPQPDEGTRFK